MKLINILNEIKVNKPGTLIPGKKYNVKSVWGKDEVLEFEKEIKPGDHVRLLFKTKDGDINVSKNLYLKKGWIKPINEITINKPNCCNIKAHIPATLEDVTILKKDVKYKHFKKEIDHWLNTSGPFDGNPEEFTWNEIEFEDGLIGWWTSDELEIL